MSAARPDSVTVGYLHDNTTNHSWHVSYTNTLLYDASGPNRIFRGGFLAQYGNEAGYDVARNKVAKAFLDDRDGDWLWWTDSDMGWGHDALERLLEVADPVERPIVGGLCFGMKPVSEDGCNGQHHQPFPTLYGIDERDDKAGFSPIYGYPVDALVQVAGTGSAFVIVHRSVLQAIRDKWGDVWYSRLPHPKNDVPFGEDLSFCLRATDLGIPIHVHTGVRTNHYKWTYLNEDSYFAQLQAPPATDDTAILVPVVGRPQNAGPFMRSLRASTGLAVVYAIAESDDLLSRAAWETAGAVVISNETAKTFAEKVNIGYRNTVEPWVFIVGDDVRFRPGWLDHAQHVAAINGAPVVGTNDGVNPRVTSGGHAVHILIRRQYIDEVGSSWDGPGVLAHEGYGHWFVDDEIVTAAKQRDVWAMALGSRVEHLHPMFGGAKDDDIYRRGQERAKDDKRLFTQRLKANT